MTGHTLELDDVLLLGVSRPKVDPNWPERVLCRGAKVEPGQTTPEPLTEEDDDVEYLDPAKARDDDTVDDAERPDE